MSRLDWFKARIRRFVELRRALPLTAAALLIGAVLLPAWRIILTAPQYRNELIVELYTYPRLGGDFEEVQLLNKYVGFHYPDPVFVNPNFEVHEAAIAVPEWTFGPLAFIAVAAAGVFVAFAPTDRKLRLGLTAQLVGTMAVFGGMFAIIQYRLYQAGHSLDPNAPMSAYEGFTPPVLGGYEIANISGYSTFGPGGYLALVAVVLLVLAFLLRKTPATIRDVPDLLRTGGKRFRRGLPFVASKEKDHHTTERTTEP